MRGAGFGHSGVMGVPAWLRFPFLVGALSERVGIVAGVGSAERLSPREAGGIAQPAAVPGAG